MKLKAFIGKVNDAEQILPMESDEFYLLSFNTGEFCLQP